MIKSDFSFLYPRSVDKLSPPDKKKVINKVKDIENKYCLNYFDENSNKNMDFFEIAKPILDGSDLVDLPCRLKEVGELISPLLNKKQKIYSALLTHFSEVKIKVRNPGSLRVSLNFPVDNFRTSPESKMLILRERMRRFFNNLRHYSVYDKIIGYFWVILKDKTSRPYVHINFYMESDKFTTEAGRQINKIWFNVVGFEGANQPQEVERYIIHFSNSEWFSNYSLNTPRNSTPGKSLIFPSSYISHDFNVHEDIELTKFLAAINKRKSEFSNYLLLLAKESFCFYEKETVLGESKRTDKTNDKISKYFEKYGMCYYSNIPLKPNMEKIFRASLIEDVDIELSYSTSNNKVKINEKYELKEQKKTTCKKGRTSKGAIRVLATSLKKS
ncbi:hypothetical protein H4F64_04905 [Pectobacterium brasiliense]|nr:hypothetical protein [Pectobacterium brasiliense]